ncbi:hypothetical protein ACIHEI_17885 [Kitasatospora sp. NPDC051984]|uniref:hypothetical protein n=1 Tax=Kitasatospora sp. NPDC051984 TaxID=3364059 RepID=UPI0037C631C1
MTSTCCPLALPRPTRAADQLLLLIDGALAAAATRPDTGPVAFARELAVQILDRRGAAAGTPRPARQR